MLILDNSGNLVVTYEYDAWGNVNVSGIMATTIGRFISSDDTAYLGATGTVTSYNLFAYCENNPVNGSYPTGNITITTCVIIGVLLFSYNTTFLNQTSL